MKYDELTPEVKEKLKNAETPQEIFAIAQEEGHELTDDELKAISGGKGPWTCPEASCLEKQHL